MADSSERPDGVVPEKVQITAWLESDRKRKQLHEIARAKKERDQLGWGATVVIRAAVDRYISRNQRHLPDELRD